MCFNSYIIIIIVITLYFLQVSVSLISKPFYHPCAATLTCMLHFISLVGQPLTSGVFHRLTFSSSQMLLFLLITWNIRWTGKKPKTRKTQNNQIMTIKLCHSVSWPGLHRRSLRLDIKTWLERWITKSPAKPGSNYLCFSGQGELLDEPSKLPPLARFFFFLFGLWRYTRGRILHLEPFGETWDKSDLVCTSQPLVMWPSLLFIWIRLSVQHETFYWWEVEPKVHV